jgi:sugar lactone lactonase YvrE
MAISLTVAAGSMSFIAHTAEEVPSQTPSTERVTIKSDEVVGTLATTLGGNDAVTIDAEGNIYVSNFGTYTNTGGTGTEVIKIAPDGTQSTFVSGLSGPLGTAFDSKGNFYVVNGNTGSKGDILKVTPSGEKSTVAEIAGWPAGIVIDADDNLYVSNYMSPNVHQITANGELSVLASDTSLAGCVGIALDASHNIVLGNYNNGKILSVNPAGTVKQITQITGLPKGFAIGYITLHNETIYASGIGNHKLYKITLDGKSEVFAGTGTKSTIDGALLEATFHNPNGMGVDAVNKKLYVVDWGNPTLRVINLK